MSAPWYGCGEDGMVVVGGCLNAGHVSLWRHHVACKPGMWAALLISRMFGWVEKDCVVDDFGELVPVGDSK